MIRKPCCTSPTVGGEISSIALAALFMGWRVTTRPHQTKEARRVKSAGFLRGYSRAAFGRFAIVRDVIRERLRNAWRTAPPLYLEPARAMPGEMVFRSPLSRQVSRAYPETGQAVGLCCRSCATRSCDGVLGGGSPGGAGGWQLRRL